MNVTCNCRVAMHPAQYPLTNEYALHDMEIPSMIKLYPCILGCWALWACTESGQGSTDVRLGARVQRLFEETRQRYRLPLADANFYKDASGTRWS